MPPLPLTAKSSNKDGAWAFIENYLNQPFDNLYSYGLPARKSALDDMVDKAMNVTYMTDENGDAVEFSIIDNVACGGERYLLVVETELMDDDETDAIILKEVSINTDDVTYRFFG